MSEENDQPPIAPIYVCAEAMPQPTDTPEQWIQRVTLLAEEINAMGQVLWHFLEHNAPMLLADRQGGYGIAGLIGGIGYTARGIAVSGTQLQGRMGLTPLDAAEEQIRLLREQSARVDISTELKAHLTELLSAAESMAAQEKATPAEDSEWPKDGFTIE